MHAPPEPNHPGRRSLRLLAYDYRQPGAYFVTVCTQGRLPLFGAIPGSQMHLNEAGRIAANCWAAIPNHHPHAQIDTFVVMPNHIHGIIFITNDHRTVGATHASPLPHASPRRRGRGPAKGSIGAIVGSYKSAVSKQINRLAGTFGGQTWQRNYYEHVIRNDTALHEIRQYILNNPAKWNEDPENPATM